MSDVHHGATLPASEYEVLCLLAAGKPVKSAGDQFIDLLSRAHPLLSRSRHED